MKSYLSIIVLSLTISFSSLLNASLLKAGTVTLLTLWGAVAGVVSTPYVSKVLTRGVTHPLILKRLSSKSIEFVTASN